ncbi:MAG: ribose 5-phosphate isomerase B [Ruminococcaceae bacterium]|nr:ribose 5-phosphate isomerase B [Oscillospiraceae bacterium]
MSKKIYIGCDHAALHMKNDIIGYLNDKGYDVEDLGPYTPESVDYPEYAEKVGKEVVSDKGSLGILICGTGIGMSLAANKVKGVRAAACSEVYSAKLTRQHNDANILCLGARVIGIETAKMMVDAFVETDFEGGRHKRRVDMIMALEDKN